MFFPGLRQRRGVAVEMKYNFKIKESGKILCVEYSGEMNVNEYVIARDNFLRLLEIHEIYKIVIFMAETFLECDILDLLSLILEIPYFFPKELQIALVSPEGDYYRYRLLLAEMICFNYGFKLRVFPDYRRAVEWLG